MSEFAFINSQIGRRDFLTRAGIALGGATAAGLGARMAADRTPASWLKPVATGDPRIGVLKRLRSARVAERAFGPLDWSAVHSAPLHAAGASALDEERIYYVPIQTRDRSSALLVLSNPITARALNDDLVVTLNRGRDPELRWSTVDGRTLVARQATGERRLHTRAAGHALARGARHPAPALAAGMAACGDAGAELARGERWPLTLYRAGASGKRRIRRCGSPIAG